jgi:hypothetical protein
MKYLKLHEIFVCHSQDASVDRATVCGLDASGSFPEKCNFSVFQNIQTGSVAHPIFYPKDTRGCFPWDKAAGA